MFKYKWSIGSFFIVTLMVFSLRKMNEQSIDVLNNKRILSSSQIFRRDKLQKNLEKLVNHKKTKNLDRRMQAASDSATSDKSGPNGDSQYNPDLFCTGLSQQKVASFSVETDLVKNNQDMEDLYRGNVEDLVDGKYGAWAMSNAKYFIILLLFIILALVQLIVFSFWGCCFSWCKCFQRCCNCGCCKREYDEQGNLLDPYSGFLFSKTSRCVTAIANLVVAFVLIIIVIVWCANTFKMIDNIPAVACGFQTILAQIVHGTTNDVKSWPGIGGFKTFLNTVKTDVNAITDSTAAQAITNRHLLTEVNTYTEAMERYYHYWKVFELISPADGSTKIKADSSTNMTPTITTDIGTESNQLKTVATSINDTARVFTLLSNPDFKKAFSLGIDAIIGQLDLAYDFLKLVDKFISKLGIYNSLNALKMLAVIVTIVFLLLTVGWGLILALDYLSKKCGGCCCLCIEKAFMILNSFCGLFCSILGLVFFVVAVMLCHFCVLQYKIYNDDAFQTKFIEPKSAEAYGVINACFLTTSSGNLTDAIKGSGGQQFNDTMSIFTGIDDFNNKFQPIYNGKTEGTSIVSYKNQLNSFKTYTANNFVTFASQGPNQALTQVNNPVKCTNDIWVLNNNDCGSTYQWTSSDASTKFNDATPICINAITFYTTGQSNSFTATTRYTNTCVSASDQSAITKVVNDQNTFNTAYSSMLDQMAGTSGSAGNGIDNTSQTGAQISATISKINATKADLATLTAQIQTSYNYVVSFPGSVKSMINCKFLRTDMVIISNSTCYAFVFAFNDFAKSLAWVGPFFFIMSLLMCFSVRCPYIRDEDLNNSPDGNAQNLDKPLTVQVELQMSPNNDQLSETQNRSNIED